MRSDRNYGLAINEESMDTANCDRSRVCCPKRRLRPEKSRIKVSGSLWPSNLGFADLRTDPIANMDVSNGETDRRDFFF